MKVISIRETEPEYFKRMALIFKMVRYHLSSNKELFKLM